MPRCTFLLLPAVALARRVAVVGAGWGGLSAAHHLSKQPGVEVILLDAAPRVGGLIRDGFTTLAAAAPRPDSTAFGQSIAIFSR